MPRTAAFQLLWSIWRTHRNRTTMPSRRPAKRRKESPRRAARKSQQRRITRKINRLTIKVSPENCLVAVLNLASYDCGGSSQFGFFGGHSGTGPPGVGVLGMAAYAKVPTRPTNSSNALSERFIGLLLRVWRTQIKLRARRRHYTHNVDFDCGRVNCLIWSEKAAGNWKAGV